MKNLFLLLCVCTLFACKKQTEEQTPEVINKNWVLNTAIISPAIQHYGKPETNYLVVSGLDPSQNIGCTIKLNDNGTYEKKWATGPLHCFPIIGNTDISEQKWVKTGDKIILTHSYLPKITATITKDKLIYTLNVTDNGVKHVVEYNFVAK